MKTGKKILAALMVLVLVAGLMPVTVRAADGEVAYAVEGGNIYFDTETGAITGCDESVTAADIPSKINGVAVTYIGEDAFLNCYDLSSIKIGEGVIGIWAYAFFGCKSLMAIEIPSSLEYIEDAVFMWCSNLEDIYYRGTEDEWNSIDIDTAYGDNNDFLNAAVHFNSTMPELDVEPSTESIMPSEPSTEPAEDSEVVYPVEGGNIYFDSETGTITGCDKSVTVANIPSRINGVAVTSIGEYAFSGCTSLASVTMANGVTNIGKYAFSGCTSLTTVAIPEGVTNLYWSAFEDCISLTTIDIPKSVTNIPETAFFVSNTSLASINVDEANAKYSSVDGVLFNKDKTELILYPKEKAATAYTIPEGVTNVGECSFYRCESLASITIPSSVTRIWDSAFSACTSLTSVNMQEGVTNIGWDAFSGCTSLASVVVPEGVTIIGNKAFANCYSLVSITIPSSVTYIGDDAFAGGLWYEPLNPLTEVYYGGSEEEWMAIYGSDYFAYAGATVHYNSPMLEPTDTPAIVSELALANKQSVLVDGEQVTFEVYALEDENGGETNYIKLRDLACMLNGTAAQFEVSWDGAVNILKGQAYTENGSEMNTPFEGDREYRPTDAVTKVDGIVTEFDAICLEDDNGGEYNYYKLRDLGRVLGFDVSWTSELGIYIETDQPYSED